MIRRWFDGWAAQWSRDRPALDNCEVMAAEHAAGRVPDYEKVLEAGYRCFLRPGAVIVDVGAHEGLHLQHFIDLAGPSGKILAFEPLPSCFETLLAHFSIAAVTLYNAALADTAGETSFVFARGSPQESGLRERTYNQPATADPVEIRVTTMRLDDVMATDPQLDFIKIDAEGAELLILRGAASVLRRLRPVVSVEYGRPSYAAYGNAAESLFDFAKQHRYVICDLFGAPIRSLKSWRRICDRTYWDWYLVPAEKLKEWTSTMAPMMPIASAFARIAAGSSDQGWRPGEVGLYSSGPA